VRTIFEDSQGTLWIGTQGGGLSRLDRDHGTFSTLRADPGDPSTLGSDFVFAVTEARDGAIWVGTYGGGIARLDRATGRFRRYTTADGLSSDSVYGMLEDESGRLWISTNLGLCRFDPATGAFHTFRADDGLQSDEFNGGSFYRSPRGEMFFGGIRGFNSFFPAEIELNEVPPPVVITDLQLFNRSMAPGEAFHGPPVLSRPIEYSERIELAHGQDVLTLEFAALHFASPERNLYRYRLEGFADDWIDARAGRRAATYTRLAPGDYLFHVRAANPDGAWNLEGAHLAIRVLPPFWATGWFRALAAASLAALLALAWTRRARAIRLQTELAAAHDAQMAIMPQRDPELPGFEISGDCVPASEVGGDFFDYIWLDGESAALVIALGDVSGKGMKSAMAAALSSGMVHAQVRAGAPLAEVMTRVNRSVRRKVERHMFTALCLAAIDPSERTLEWVNAAMCPPLLKRDGAIVELTSEGSTLPLGSFADTVYRSRKIPLEPGDVLLLFADGVPEATDRNGALYGYEAVRDFFAAQPTRSLSARRIQSALVREIARFAKGSGQHDDMTLVVVKAL